MIGDVGRFLRARPPARANPPASVPAGDDQAEWAAWFASWRHPDAPTAEARRRRPLVERVVARATSDAEAWEALAGEGLVPEPWLDGAARFRDDSPTPRAHAVPPRKFMPALLSSPDAALAAECLALVAFERLAAWRSPAQAHALDVIAMAPIPWGGHLTSRAPEGSVAWAVQLLPPGEPVELDGLVACEGPANFLRRCAPPGEDPYEARVRAWRLNGLLYESLPPHCPRTDVGHLVSGLLALRALIQADVRLPESGRLAPAVSGRRAREVPDVFTPALELYAAGYYWHHGHEDFPSLYVVDRAG